MRIEHFGNTRVVQQDDMHPQTVPESAMSHELASCIHFDTFCISWSWSRNSAQTGRQSTCIVCTGWVFSFHFISFDLISFTIWAKGSLPYLYIIISTLQAPKTIHTYNKAASITRKEGFDTLLSEEEEEEDSGEKLQEMFPWSIHLTCFAHSLHLIPKDRSICTSSFKEVFATAHKMISLCNQSLW
jgi:hypothetical protein